MSVWSEWAPWEPGKGCRRWLTGNAGAEEPGGRHSSWGAPPETFPWGSSLAFTLPPRYPEGRQVFFLAANQDQARRLLGELIGGEFPGFRVVMG